VPVPVAFAVVVVADSHRRPLPLLLLLLAAEVAGEGHEAGCHGSRDVEEEEPQAGGESRRERWIRERAGGDSRGGALDPQAGGESRAGWRERDSRRGC
jgi:hypothetical protein